MSVGGAPPVACRGETETAASVPSGSPLIVTMRLPSEGPTGSSAQDPSVTPVASGAAMTRAPRDARVLSRGDRVLGNSFSDIDVMDHARAAGIHTAGSVPVGLATRPAG